MEVINTIWLCWEKVICFILLLISLSLDRKKIESILKMCCDLPPLCPKDAEEHFRVLGVERFSEKQFVTRMPATKRPPLKPLVLDKIKSKKREWSEEPRLIAELLETIASANGKVVVAGKLAAQKSDFECVTAPPMSITAYMRQLSTLGGGDSVWPAALSMIDRIDRRAGLPFTPLTAHRVLLTSYSIVSKEVAIDGGSHNQIAQTSGVSPADLHKMESSFLRLLQNGSEIDEPWDALIGLQDAPAIRGALPKIARRALRDHALRAVSKPTVPVHILPEYLDSSSSAASAVGSSSSTSSSISSSSRFSRRFSAAHSYASLVGDKYRL